MVVVVLVGAVVAYGHRAFVADLVGRAMVAVAFVAVIA